MSLGQTLRTGLTFTAQLLRFYSRLPMPKLPFEADPHAMPDFARAAPYLPFAGLIIGASGAFSLLTASVLNLGAPLSAILAVACLVIATGALHEDGLADVADGFWGGTTPERRLDIMKDSRIGAYGAAALVLSLLLRTIAIAEMIDRTGPVGAALAILTVAPLSRVCALTPLTFLPPARPFGASKDAGKPPFAHFVVATGTAIAIVLVAASFTRLIGPAIAAIIIALIIAMGMTRLSRAKIGGQTGDVIGATQQMTEIAFLLTLVAGA